VLKEISELDLMIEQISQHLFCGYFGLAAR
jgi:hypothetical protein